MSAIGMFLCMVTFAMAVVGSIWFVKKYGTAWYVQNSVATQYITGTILGVSVWTFFYLLITHWWLIFVVIWWVAHEVNTDC